MFGRNQKEDIVVRSDFREVDLVVAVDLVTMEVPIPAVGIQEGVLWVDKLAGVGNLAVVLEADKPVVLAGGTLG